MRNRILAAAAGLAVAVFGVAGTAHAGKDLDAVRARGVLNCGVGIGTAGFMALTMHYVGMGTVCAWLSWSLVIRSEQAGRPYASS